MCIYVKIGISKKPLVEEKYMNKIPTKSIDLIKELDKNFPNKLPTNINFNEKDIAFLMGQRSVIDHLLFLIKNKNEVEGIDDVF